MKLPVYSLSLMLLACHALNGMHQPQTYTLSGHASVRMKQRSIAPIDVINTLRWGKKAVENDKIFCTLGKPYGKKKKYVTLVLNEEKKRVVTVMKKPEEERAEKELLKIRRRRKMSHSQDGRKMIPFLYVLEPKTTIEKNIVQAMKHNNEALFNRLLDLASPYKANDRILARCFMQAVKLDMYIYASAILARATSIKQLQKIPKDDYFRSLTEESVYPELYRQYNCVLLARKIVQDLQQKR